MPRHLLARAGQAHNGQTLTADMIRDVAQSFDSIGRSPLTFGHPKSQSAPKAGNVTSVEASEDYTELYGTIEPLDKVAELAQDGFFDDRSVGIGQAPDGTHYLHHVALLGGVPPAIKGMPALKELGVEFSESDEVLLFDAPSGNEDNAEGALLNRFFDRLQRLFSNHDADTTMADNNTNDEPTRDELQARIDELEGKLEAQSEDDEPDQGDGGEPSDQDFTDSDEYKAFMRERKQFRQERREREISDVRDALEGKVPTATVDAFADLAEALPDVVTFSDGDEEEEKSPRAQLADALNSLKLGQLVNGGEYEFSDDDGSAAEVRKKTAQAM